jgi:hypothetical protein
MDRITAGDLQAMLSTYSFEVGRNALKIMNEVSSSAVKGRRGERKKKIAQSSFKIAQAT